MLAWLIYKKGKMVSLLENIKEKFSLIRYSILFPAIALLIIILNLAILSKISLLYTMPKHLIIIDLVVIGALFFYIIKRYKNLFSLKKVQTFNQKNHLHLKSKLVFTFSFLCMVPIALIFLFSFFFFSFNKEFFSTNLSNNNSNQIETLINDYKKEQENNLVNKMNILKEFIIKDIDIAILKKNDFEEDLSQKTKILNLENVVIYSQGKNTNILLKIGAKINKELIAQSKNKLKDKSHIIFYEENKIFALSPLKNIPKGYFLVAENEQNLLIKKLSAFSKEQKQENNKVKNIQYIETQFSLILFLIALITTLSILIFTLGYVSKILLPLLDIIISNRKITRGNYNIKISEKNLKGEISILIKSYNEMVKSITSTNEKLTKDVKDTEHKKSFLENILGNYPSCVIALDKDYKIKLFNKKSAELLEHKNLTNKDITTIMPVLEGFLKKLDKTDKYSQKIKFFGNNDKSIDLYLIAARQVNQKKNIKYIMNITEI